MTIKTYGELKNALPSTGTGRVPGYKRLREQANLYVMKKTDTGTIEVYDNGYFIFMTCDQRTVYGVDRCDSNDLYKGIVGGGRKQDFDSCPWEIILEAAGAERLAHSNENNADNKSARSLDEPGAANDIAFSVLPEHEVRERVEEEAEWKSTQIGKMKAVIGTLTEMQKEAIFLRKYEGLSQAEIADRMGLSRRAVRRHLELAEKKLKEFRG